MFRNYFKSAIRNLLRSHIVQIDDLPIFKADGYPIFELSA